MFKPGDVVKARGCSNQELDGCSFVVKESSTATMLVLELANHFCKAHPIAGSWHLFYKGKSYVVPEFVKVE